MNEDKAARYNRLKRNASVLSLVVSVACVVAFLVTGASIGLRDFAERIATRVSPAAFAPTAAVVVYVALLLVVMEVVPLPLSFYGGYLLERRYELSNESLGAWLRDQLKALAIGERQQPRAQPVAIQRLDCVKQRQQQYGRRLRQPDDEQREDQPGGQPPAVGRTANERVQD